MKRIMKFFRVIKKRKRNIKKHFLLSFNNVFYLLLLTSLLLLLAFQNCSSNLSQAPNLFSEERVSNDKGYIIAYLPSEDESLSIEDHFLIDSGVKLKVMNSHSDSENFKWKITRAFETITDGEEATTEPEYQYQFKKSGSYDIFAASYKDSDLLTLASKRLVIGEECSLTDVLDIFLESGSLTAGQTATFELKNATDFSNIVWKATLPSSTVINDDDDSESIELDLTDESTGSVTIEVSAEDPDNSDCLTYRKQVLQVSSNSKPHFNPIIIKHNDEEIALMLENNNIYKYLRPEGGTWTLHTNIQNANQCEIQIDSGSEDVLNCSDGVIDITSSESCVKSTLAIQASTSSSTSIDSQTSVDDIVEQFYYNYCPSGGSYCYFSGPLPGPLSYQTCDNSILSQAVTRNPSSIVNGECNNSVKNGCSQGTLNDIGDSETHYQWQCLGTNDGTDATDCSMAIDTAAPINGVCDDTIRNGCTVGTPDDVAIADTSTHYTWHCVGSNGGATASCTKAIPVNGVCNNSQRNSCSAGTANDGAIADTNTHYTWHCVGTNGGTTANNCQKAKPSTPVNGVCNNSQRNSCSAGTANDGAIADTKTHYRWHCVGSNGGTTATNCQKAKAAPVNGVCNNSQQNGCSTGTANDAAIADTNTHYRWQCVGTNGGSTATNCQKAKPSTPVNGVCKNSQQNGCSTGTANDAAIADTNTHYRWHCIGANGGTTATNCQKAKAINGVCKNSQRNGCSTGTANDGAIADTKTHYRWHCVGANGGNTATNCQKAKAINGACKNSQRNGCSTGTANDGAIADTKTHYRWHCVGANGGNTATNCQKAKAINGACKNSQRNGCSSGTANDNAIADTTTHYRWHCIGANGGNTATNCQKAKAINGACNNSQRNSCSTGTANDGAIADTNTHYRWHCVGSNGGTTAQNCQKAKPAPVNGVCNNSQRNGCSAGRANDAVIADTNTHYTWYCEGSNGGTTAQNCQKARPVNGVCDNSQQNGCSAGTANDNAIADTNTHYRWHCVGANGGSTAQNCQKAKPVPVNGVCNNAQRNSCFAGRANDNAIADTNTHYTWHCEGEHGGTTVTNCQKAIPIDGVCDESQRNGCSAGTVKALSDEAHPTLYVWICEGLHGGKKVSCNKPK